MKTCRIYTGILFLSSLFWVGCNSEDDLVARPEQDNVWSEYSLPQGDHDYDKEIVEMYGKYNTLILYKFADKDLWWNGGKDIRWWYDSSTNKTYGGYGGKPAMEDHVGRQLDLLQQAFFVFFPDTLLHRTTPFRVMLTSELNLMGGGVGKPNPANLSSKNVLDGFDYIAVNWGSEKNMTMTPTEVNSFKTDICILFMNRIADRGQISVSEEFTSVTNYTAVTLTNYMSLGIISWNDKSPFTDWKAYIKAIVSNPKSVLEAEGGILHPKKDTGGMIRKKYDLMISYFLKEYNLDLQAIGDSQPVLK